MTTKIISGTISGYTFTSPTTTVSVTATGYVRGGGISAGNPTAYTVVNYGRVDSSNYGVNLASGDSSGSGVSVVTNGGQAYTHALIEGANTGVAMVSTAQIANFGTIIGAASEGVYAGNGGSFTNGSIADAGATIEGASGMRTGHAAATVTNYGAIVGAGAKGTAIYLPSGGGVTNGAQSGDTTALIEGYYGVRATAAASIANFGSILSTGGYRNAGAYFSAGGSLANGSAIDSAGLVDGVVGVEVRGASGTVTNFATIKSIGVGDVGFIDDGDAIGLDVGGKVQNGAGIDTVALITGPDGVYISGGAGTVTNFGTIQSTLSAAGAFGVSIGAGAVTNGSATDQGALIESYQYGLNASGPATVVNAGTIESTQATAVSINATGSSLTNGGGGDRSALIEGADGLSLGGAGGTLANFATIRGTQGVAVSMGGGSLTNGAVNDTSALIAGYDGVEATGAGGAANLGTIQATGVTGTGVYLGADITLTNGAVNDRAGLVEGPIGVRGSGTLINYGAIRSSGGSAVQLTGAAATLIVEAGSVFEGSVTGGGGVIELGSGVGTLSGLAGGDVTVSGSMATTKFDDFGTVKVGLGAQFTLSGNANVAAGEALTDAGALTAAGTITDGGAVTTTGTLSGTGTLALAGGIARFDAGTDLTLAHVTVSGAATATVNQASLAYAGLWNQTAGTLTVKAGDEVSFTGTGDSFAGTLAGAGTVALTGGSDTLTGTTLSATSVTITTASVTLLDAITINHILTAATANLIIGVAGATLTGGGTLALTNAATNRITVTAAAASFTNLTDTISGAGTIGDGAMTLTNEAAGIIDANDTLALTLDTGTHTIANAGTIEATGAGGLTLSSPVDNAGDLVAADGTLTVNGAVTGAGVVQIDAGTADIATTSFKENVDFTGTTGVLELASSKSYSGQITGLSKTGTNSLDLKDIAFAGTTTAAYSGTTTSGVLTVKEGANTASIHLIGDYLGSTFTLSAATGGGTKVVDPAADPIRPPAPAPLTRFIASAAGFSSPAAGPIHSVAEAWRNTPPLIAMPGTQSQ